MNQAQAFDERYNVTPTDLKAQGAKWNPDYAVYEFPDGSWGMFTDLRDGAAEQYRDGRPALRFVMGNPR